MKPEITKNSSNASFFQILEKELVLQGFQVKAGYNNVLAIENFVYEGMRVNFEPKGGCFRMDFRINQHYRSTNLVFNHLNARADILQREIDTHIEFGTQMKRLKFDIDIFENYQYPNWTVKEFELLWPHAISILNMLRKELKTDVYKGLLSNLN